MSGNSDNNGCFNVSLTYDICYKGIYILNLITDDLQLVTLGQRTEFGNANHGGGRVATTYIVTRLSDAIETLFRCFQGCKLFDDTIRNTAGWNRKSEIQDGSWRNEIKRLSASIYESNVIPPAVPMFSGSGNATRLLWRL